MKKTFTHKKWLFLTMMFSFPLLLGFRILPTGNNWAISSTDPTLWIKFCSTPTFTDTTLPSGDPLTTKTFAGAMQSIVDDYNNVNASFVRLAMYPADPSSPGTPATGDSTFTTTKAATRTIDVCFQSGTLFSGHALPTMSTDGKVIGCSIKLTSTQVEKMKDFVSTLTHEIGHCLGMDHPQETTMSVMSYFSGTDIIRLQAEDKAAISYLYPGTEADVKMKDTFGMSCAHSQ